MSYKIKKEKNTSQKINEVAKQAGIALMAMAATLGMLESPEHPNARIILPNQPSFALANVNVQFGGGGNQMIREREEAAPHYIDYSTVQRTVSRSGKR